MEPFLGWATTMGVKAFDQFLAHGPNLKIKDPIYQIATLGSLNLYPAWPLGLIYLWIVAAFEDYTSIRLRNIITMGGNKPSKMLSSRVGTPDYALDSHQARMAKVYGLSEDCEYTRHDATTTTKEQWCPSSIPTRAGFFTGMRQAPYPGEGPLANGWPGRYDQAKYGSRTAQGTMIKAGLCLLLPVCNSKQGVRLRILGV